MAAKKFGELFKKLRLKSGYSLREYCRRYDKDAAFISKMERGKVAPPLKTESLEELALSVGLKRNSEEWSNFISAALISAGRIPKEALSNEQVLQYLPLFLRTMTGEKIPESQLDELIEVIKNA